MYRLAVIPLAILVASLVLSPLPARADGGSSTSGAALRLMLSGEDGDSGDVRTKGAHNAGTIDGQVAAVDYQRGVISVQAANRKVDVYVLPSTNIIARDNSFHTIADIAKGARVQVLMSQRGSLLYAQIIHLR